MVKKTVPWFGLILVVVAIIGGFVIVGSPAQQRAMRFDQQRVSDLQSIQWQVINYWQRKQALPLALSDLDDTSSNISNFSVPVDPETGASYEYSVSGANGPSNNVSNPGLGSRASSFELCATFSTDSHLTNSSSNIAMRFAPSGPNGVVNNNWDHSVGRVCFDRMIDSNVKPVVQ